MSRDSEERRTSARDWAKKPSLSGFESMCVKLPEGVEQYKLEIGIHKVDFMPYKAGKWNRRADEGFAHFELEYEAHRVPTGNGTQLVLCRRATMDKSCAVCDWLKRNGGHADRDLVAKLRATTRHLWVVNDRPGSKKNTLKVLDANHFNKKKGFGEQMAAAINTLDEGAEPFNLKGGYYAVLTIEEETFPGGKYTLASRIDLRPRDYDYPSDILDRAPCLDDCLIDPGYDDVLRLLDTGSTPDKDDDDDVGKASNGSGTKATSKPTSRVVDDDDDKPTSKAPVKGKKPTHHDDDDDEEELEEPSDLDDDDSDGDDSDIEEEEDKVDEPPARKGKGDKGMTGRGPR